MSLARTIAEIPSKHGMFHPGTIAHFAMGAAPDGWLACSGQAVSRTTYAELFAAVGDEFGAGDGSTTFNLPDLRGEFIRGWDNGRGIDTGRAFGAAQGQAIQPHTHEYSGYSEGYFPTDGRASLGSGTSADPNAAQTSASTGGAETRPRNIALLGCIKT